MRIWTTQTLSFWNLLQEQGTVHCDSDRATADEFFKNAYDWMASEMAARIGPPPRAGIAYPIWGWQQVGCYKKELHPGYNDCGGDEDEFVFITADIPADQMLLSDFDMWNLVLNGIRIPTGRRDRKEDEESVRKSWELIFDLDRPVRGYPSRRNRRIQATFWELRKEWIVSAQRISGYQAWLRKKMAKLTEGSASPLED